MYYITYDNETVVYNSDHKQLVKCPTDKKQKNIYTTTHKNIVTCKLGLVKLASPFQL